MIEKSFSLVRTNPALTGNVKLVVSSDYKLYLESFGINKTLTMDRFRHFEIKKEEYYKEVIPYFFKDVENQTIFDVKFNNDVANMYDNFRYQYDDTYFSGAYFSQDTWYQEEYEYLAPLYLKNNKLPKSFMILRVDGPGSLTEDSSPDNFRSQIVDQWKFVKMFDLTENSDLGYWLNRNYINDDAYPEMPFILRHGEVSLSELSGLDIETGGWIKKFINLHEELSQNTPTFKGEEFFTRLWEDNHLIYPNIINMKFLFDDTPASPSTLRPYTINRYLGFYIEDMPVVKTVSPYEGYELLLSNNNKNDRHTIESMTAIETSQIPYLKNNIFVRDINGRSYSVDPIKKGWDDTLTYWVEWNSKFYRLEKIKNPETDLFKQDAIIGDFLFRIVADITIQNTNIPEVYNNDLTLLLKRVLINELSTGKEKIKIVPQQTFNNVIARNIIENVNTLYVTSKRIPQIVTVNNQQKVAFRITYEGDLNNNIFKIDGFNDADLFLIKISDQYHVIKQYPLNTPNVGGKYYIQTDKAIFVNDKAVSDWINNGNITRDPNYFNFKNIENLGVEQPPFFEIIKINFSDIKDFDFDRVETDYSNFEYEIDNEPTPTAEPKLYAKEWREIGITVKSLPSTVDKVRRIPILDINNRPYNSRTDNGEINSFTGKPYTDSELYRKEYDGSWSLFSGTIDGTNWINLNETQNVLHRKYYREEHYVLRIDDQKEIDFKTNSDPVLIEQQFNFGDDGLAEISNPKIPLPQIQSSNNPNDEYDPNYIPTTSEYIASEELWELKNQTLTPIWYKNQYVCKWSFLNSVGLHDNPYRLNFDLEVGGVYNREPNPYSGRNYPVRKYFDLDYFYRFGLTNPTSYLFHSLHLKEQYFDIDKYIDTTFDYFELIFKSDQEFLNGIRLTEKYSNFIIDGASEAFTLFRGIKYFLADVVEVKLDEDEIAETGKVIIDDIITAPNTKYNDYRFSVVFGKKLPTFQTNPGLGNSNMGIDVYLNDKFKNVIIHIYINTNSDETIQLLNDSNQLINAESCQIDTWYKDNLERREVDPTAWDNSEFKINGFGINLRPRDFMLLNFLTILNNKNFDPTVSGNKEKVNFIHIYDDGRPTAIMDYFTSDFTIRTELPEEILFKEDGFKIMPVDVNFVINNTYKNRIILDDDPNSPTNNKDFTSDGFRVGSLLDINSYNEYPIAKSFDDSTDKRVSYLLDDETDPSIFRYSGPYVPLFKTIPLFRPLGYLQLTKQGNTPTSESGNWKFYDPNSSSDKPVVLQFGSISELIFSKCNSTANVLKFQATNSIERSVYPMVDEYGYEFDSKYLFAANWEPSFHYTSRRIEVEPNEYPDIAGYTIFYDGLKDYLRIPDKDKFNLERYFVDEVNFENYILNQPEGERSLATYTLNNVSSELVSGSIATKNIELKLLARKAYNMTIDFFNASSSGMSLDIWIEIINDVNDPTQTNRQLLSINQLSIPIGSNKTSIPFQFNTLYSASVSTTTYINHPFTSDDMTNFGGTMSSFPQLDPKYIYGNVVNARINFRLNGSSDARVDLYPVKLEMQNGSQDNILDINFGTTSGTGGPILQDDIGVFGGYFRTDTEVGDVLLYPTKIDSYNTFADLKNNLLAVSNTHGKNNKSLSSSRGFAITTTNQNRDGIFVRVTNPTPFTFEPERWTTIKDGCQITYVGQTDGDVSVNPSLNLKWYTVQNTAPKRVLTIHKNLIHTSILQTKITLPLLKKKINLSNVKVKIPFVKNKNLNIFNSKIELPAVVQYDEPQVTIELPDSIIFDIIPVNGDNVSVNVKARHPDDNSPLNIDQVIGLMNNQITPAYEASHDTAGSTINYKSIKIVSRYSGSFYNFNISNIGPHVEYVKNSLVEAKTETTTSVKLTKTSLKEGTKRVTGYMADITVEFWVRIDGWTKKYETILYKGKDSTLDVWQDTTFNDFTYIIGKNGDSDKLAFKTCHIKFDGTYEKHILASNTDISDGSWHHVACIVDTLNRHKSIIIDGNLDSYQNDFLFDSYDENAKDNERVALFLDHLSRFIPNSVTNILLPNNLAQKIRLESQDSTTQYWFDAIRGFRNLNYWDKENQALKWGVTIDIAFRKFEENFKSLDFYLNVDKNLSWDILIGTDSSLTLGNRTFKGALDELRIWNYARTEEQIKANHHFILRPESYLDPLNSLVAYYRFDEGKGVNTLKDLMHGKMIKDLTRWASITTAFVNDGSKEGETDDTTFYQFETDFYEGSDISVNLDDIEWIISEADIKGFSDERYVTSPPPPSVNMSFKQLEKPIFKKTEFMLEKIKKPILPINDAFNNTSTPSGTQHKKTWFQKITSTIGEDANKVVNVVSNVVSNIAHVIAAEPKKIVQAIAKAPAKVLKAIGGLFKKKKKK